MEKFKYILTVIIILFTITTYAQPAQYTPMTASGYQMKRLKVDSTLHLPSFCGVPTILSSTAKEGALAIDTCGALLYMWTRTGGWDTVNTSGGGGAGGDFWKTSGTTNLSGEVLIKNSNGTTKFQGNEEDLAKFEVVANNIEITAVSGDLKFINIESLTDTSTYKPLMISSGGLVKQSTSWVSGGSAGTDTTKVPYTGANKDVNIGTHDLFTNKVYLSDESNGNYGSIHYTDGDFHVEDADNHKLLVIEDGFMQLHLNDTIQSNIFTTSLTQVRNHTLPDKSGTFALTSDTISLSNRINLKLNTADTSTLSNRINLKLNTADTSTLSNRINLKLNTADTSTLSNRINLKLNTADTSTLSNRINLKLNTADTSTLSNRINLKLNTADTSTLSNRINLKLNTADTASLSNRINQTPTLTGYQLLGSNIKSFPLGITGFANSTGTLAHVSSRMYLVAFYIPQTTTITGAKWILTSTGTLYVGGANYNGLVLYSYNIATGLATRIDSTASDANTWATAIGTQSKAFVTPISLSPGIYYLGAMCNGTATTFPSIAQNTQTNGATTYDLASPAKLTGYITGIVSAASFNLSTATANTNYPILMLY